ncbi:MAG: sugar phosphate isomerase/epimerase [Firmicutes bacterium]|nr:sugar phosphate isomerase/epimerase [Bacillota bacterium]
MKVGLCTIAFREFPLGDIIEIARSIGVDGIEIWGQAPHVGPNIGEKDLEAVRHMIVLAGLRVSVYGSYIRFAAQGRPINSEEDFRNSLMITKSLGAPIMRVWVGDKPSREMRDDDWDLAQKSLARACKEAKEYGITLAMEMHDGYFTDTAATTLKLIQDVCAPNLRANYQPSFRPDHDDIMEGFRMVKEFIANVHAQNFNRFATTPDDQIERSLLSEGAVNYKDMIRELRDVGYRGFISIEFIKEPDKFGNVRADAAYLINNTRAIT